MAIIIINVISAFAQLLFTLSEYNILFCYCPIKLFFYIKICIWFVMEKMRFDYFQTTPGSSW